MWARPTGGRPRLSLQQTSLARRRSLNACATETAPTIRTQSFPRMSAALSRVPSACLSIQRSATQPAPPSPPRAAPRPQRYMIANMPTRSLPLRQRVYVASRTRLCSGEPSRLRSADRSHSATLRSLARSTSRRTARPAKLLRSAQYPRRSALPASTADHSCPQADSGRARATHARSSASVHRRPDRSMFPPGTLLRVEATRPRPAVRQSLRKRVRIVFAPVVACKGAYANAHSHP